ncbi:MAG: pyridoxamine 5'-phosphate oxidase family protein [Actinobacteria bacterium]|nr:pyridoxamine 5'-phosphate oxidase family protein [Actinomycetota bacterium]
MHETAQDLVDLQTLLDSSYEAAGPHIRDVITPARRMDARQVCDALVGMNLLTLATSTADGRPLAGPVDAFFFRGSYWFGSASHSMRMRHITRRPHVSAVYLPGEHLSVTIHGRAYPAADADPGMFAGFQRVCVSHYGDSWFEWAAEASYAYILADKMFTFWMPETLPSLTTDD